MNQILVALGLESWKSTLALLVMPPVPLLLMVLVGTRLAFWRRWLGWSLVLAGVAGLWLAGCAGFARQINDRLLQPPPAYSAADIAALKQKVAAREPVAIVVLGGGLRPFAPEYRLSNLNDWSLERLRYGVWLSRQTGAPLAFSGGTGHGDRNAGLAEATTAARIAAEEFGRPLRWIEDRSRDTRENAAYSVALLKEAGIRHVVVVTHQMHMTRAIRNFERAARGTLTIEAAPVVVQNAEPDDARAWVPSMRGALQVQYALHELFGLLAGA